MPNPLAFLSEWPYFLWAVGAATIFYSVTALAVSHLHPDKKAHLSLWLQGDYQSTWAAQFCATFDSIFGENHLRPRCILLSAIASILAVLALWLLFDPILGLISLRANTGLSLTQALLLGAAINIVPDYISLFETRWLLKLFDRIRNPFGQIAVLVLDAVISGLIIFASIALYLLVSGKPQISLVEMMALFSFYAIFFYSTFLTSLWAWAYCLSSWVSQISAHLRNWLDVRNDPGRSLAFIGAAVVLVGSLVLKPALTMDEDGRIGADDFLCSVFPASACKHVARLTKDEKQKLAYLARACIGGVTEECLRTGFALFDADPEQAVALFTKSCNVGDAAGCTNLGFMYERALGVDQDYARALDLFKQGCEGGYALGCTNLGAMYANALGVDQDYARAFDLFKQGCENGDAGGCTNLGILYRDTLGVDQDYARAIDLYEQGCEGGSAAGCTNLGAMYGNALGVDRDYGRAFDLFKQGCEDGDALGCKNLGLMYEHALGIDQDLGKARALYKKTCEMKDDRVCKGLPEFAE